MKTRFPGHSYGCQRLLSGMHPAEAPERGIVETLDAEREAIYPCADEAGKALCLGTAWIGFYCLTMLSIALELAEDNPVYEDLASKFFEHFVAIADAINTIGGSGLWDEDDGFYYDQLKLDGSRQPQGVSPPLDPRCHRCAGGLGGRDCRQQLLHVVPPMRTAAAS